MGFYIVNFLNIFQPFSSFYSSLSGEHRESPITSEDRHGYTTNPESFAAASLPIFRLASDQIRAAFLALD